jgi:hypothetical protein
MKSDQEFVDNLIGVVKRNYTNAKYDILSMAAEMNISEAKARWSFCVSSAWKNRCGTCDKAFPSARLPKPLGFPRTRISRHVSEPGTASRQSACRQRKVVVTEREIVGFLITDKPHVG